MPTRKKKADKTYSYAEYVQKFRPQSIQQEEEKERKRNEPLERGKLTLDRTQDNPEPSSDPQPNCP